MFVWCAESINLLLESDGVAPNIRHLSEDGVKKLVGEDGQPVQDVRQLVKLALDVSSLGFLIQIVFNRKIIFK